MLSVVQVVIVLSALGLVLGWGIALAAKRFAVHEDPLIEKVDDVLPKGQCGACGYAGCRAYAEAVVTDKEVSASLCVPGGEDVAAKVAQLTGKMLGAVVKRVSALKCTADVSKAARSRYVYKGIETCAAASLVQGGPSMCGHSCLGFGDCEKACPFNAIIMKDGRPSIDREACTGCGICVKICPRMSLTLLPADALVHVYCHNPAKGAAKRKLCPSACLGCAVCFKACPFKVITMKDNLAHVDWQACPPDCPRPCLEKCPTASILRR
jgi:RnfABCDGE-type electron transport complex B subunit